MTVSDGSTLRGPQTDWHLAAFNIARAKFETDDDRMAPFMNALERINKLGDESPGAVWRHSTDDGDSTSVRMFEDPLILINYTIWESVESLQNYTYKTDHVQFLKRRREWFEPVEDLPVLVLWWTPAGTIPTLEQARTKLLHLRDNGPTSEAFTFREPFAPPTI